MHANVSAILSTYNGEKYLCRQLDSILNQQHKLNHILIIDDVSSDSTISIPKEYSSKYPEIECVFNEQNVGPTINFFRGLSKTNGDYIVFCDQDDIWFPEKISTQLSKVVDAEVHNEFVCSFHNAVLIDSDDKVIQESYWKYRNIEFESHNFEKSLTRNIMTGCTIMINKKLGNLINQKLKTHEDILFHDHFICLLAYSVAKVVAISKPLIYYRNHTTSVTSKQNRSIFTIVYQNLMLLMKSQYLEGNIRQAIKFKKDFSNIFNDRGDLEDFNEKLDFFIDGNIRSIMGENAYNFMMENYLVSHSYNKIIEKLGNV